MTAHAHRFLVAPPSGPTSQGTCACGIVRTFKNSYETAKGDGYWRNISNRTKKRFLASKES